MKDPIVEEVHRVRRELWDECGGDLQKLITKLKTIEAEEQHRVISIERLQEFRSLLHPPVADDVLFAPTGSALS